MQQFITHPFFRSLPFRTLNARFAGTTCNNITVIAIGGAVCIHTRRIRIIFRFVISQMNLRLARNRIELIDVIYTEIEGLSLTDLAGWPNNGLVSLLRAIETEQHISAATATAVEGGRRFFVQSLLPEIRTTIDVLFILAIRSNFRFLRRLQAASQATAPAEPIALDIRTGVREIFLGIIIVACIF